MSHAGAAPRGDWGPNAFAIRALFDTWTTSTREQRETAHRAVVELGGIDRVGLHNVAEQLPLDRVGPWLRVGYDSMSHAIIHRPRRVAPLWLAARAVAIQDLVGLMPAWSPLDYYRAVMPWLAAFGPADVLQGTLGELIGELIPEHQDGAVPSPTALRARYGGTW